MSVVDCILRFRTQMKAESGIDYPVIAIEVTPDMWFKILGKLSQGIKATIPVETDSFQVFGITIRKTLAKDTP